MDAALAALTLLCLVLLSGLFVRLRWLPLPLVQIGLGAIVASLPSGPRIAFDPGLFMLLFLPPLLFSDGWRISKREFAAHRRAILMLALGLVVLTVACAGHAVHWLVPAIPLPAAFVLAAALSPTDAIAVSALARRAVPAPLAQILEGETLINDASGLAAFKLALAMAVGAGLAPAEAARDLLWTAAGGVLVGLVASLLFRRIHAVITRHCEASAETANLLLLIVPYATYLVAEHAGCSGILAVATAGLAAGRMTTIKDGRPVDRLLGAGLWGMLGMVLGGMVFVLVGMQLPALVGEVASAAAGRSPAVLAAEVAGVFLVLVVIRAAWIRATLGLAGLRDPDCPLARLPGWRASLAAALAGVRGPITLAAVLALPASTLDGAAFPARPLLVVLASGVVLLSLLVAAIGLPLMARGMRGGTEDGSAELQAAEVALATAALQAAEQHCSRAATGEGDDALQAAASHAIARCRRRIVLGRGSDETGARARRAAEAEHAMWLAILRAERDELYRLRALERIGDPVLHDVLRRLDLAEVTLLDSARRQP